MTISHSTSAPANANNNFNSSSFPANNDVAFVPAGAVLIDESDNRNRNSNSNTVQDNSNVYGVASGQIVPSGSDQPATSYSLPTAAMVHDGFKPTAPQQDLQQRQGQQAGPQNVGYQYATSVAGQPVLVSISPIAAQGQVNPELSAAHHENPVSKAIRRRNRRHRRAAIGGAAGIITGAVVLGPFGILLGYLAGSAVGATTAVAGEQRKERRLAREREALAGSGSVRVVV